MPPAKKPQPKTKAKPAAKPKAKPKPKPKPGLTVAVTGPTGEIGKPFIRALEKARGVERIIGMARRPFDPAAHGWKKTEYRQGDVLDRASVENLIVGADVVVHLAFIIVAGSDESEHINLEGSRNVFETCVEAEVDRLVYASSVAAYGFPDVEGDITEEVPAAGSERMPYSHHKSEVEALLNSLIAPSDVDAFVFRPCIVAGPEAPILVNSIPFVSLGDKLPGVVRALFDQVPILKPVLPDPGVPFQLVHHDDVASALVSGVLGKGEPGAYNLAGDGTITVANLADAMGYYSVAVPDLAVDVTAEVAARLPFLPDEASWIEAVRRPTVMSTDKARKVLGWKPEHDALETLRQTVEAARPDLAAAAE